MSKTYETGHAKNLANFNTLIIFCKGYGAVYNPAQAVLQVSGLQTLANTAQTAFDDAKVKQLAFDKAVDERMIAYSPLRALAQRMVAALLASGSSTETLNGAKAINRKIQGRRKTKTNDTTASNPAGNSNDPSLTPQTDKQISASQKSYDNQTANFSAFIELLKGQSEYQPNETELQIATLTSYLNTLKERNAAVVDAYTAWSNSRINRDKIMYATGTGFTTISQQVKNYVKSVFGNGSPEYKQIRGLEIKKITR